jgi:hypothetical protein
VATALPLPSRSPTPCGTPGSSLAAAGRQQGNIQRVGAACLAESTRYDLHRSVVRRSGWLGPSDAAEQLSTLQLLQWRTTRQRVQHVWCCSLSGP